MSASTSSHLFAFNLSNPFPPPSLTTEDGEAGKGRSCSNAPGAAGRDAAKDRAGASDEIAGTVGAGVAADGKACLPCTTRENYRGEIQRFQDGMMRAVDERASRLPPDTAAQLRADARHSLRRVMKETFGAPLPEGEACVTTRELSGRVERAGHVAATALERLVANAVDGLMIIATDRLRASTAPVMPQIVPRADGGFNLIRRAPPIENLVLTGGGAKGVGMGGALAALADDGLLDNLRAVAGSSAGALVATWLGVGRGIDELNDILAGGLGPLLATDDTLNETYPDISFPATAWGVAKLLSPLGATHDTATGVIRKLDEITAQEASAFLQGRGADALRRDVTALVLQRRKADGQPAAAQDEAVRQRVDRILTRLEVLAEQPDFTRSRRGRMVTFSDMALLRSLAPEKFRHVSMSVHDTTTGRNITFDRRTTPTLPVAYGARASMAHPLIATGVSFPGFSGSHARHVFSDGGISSNVPIEMLVPPARPRSASDPTDLRPPALQREHAASALMVFDNEGATDRILYAPTSERSGDGFFSRLGASISSAVTGWVASNPHMAKDTAADREKVHDFGPGVITIKHGDLSTMDLDASRSRKLAAIDEARADARRQMGIARGDLYPVEVASVGEAFSLLDEEEKALLRSGGDPSHTAGASAGPQQQLRLMALREVAAREALARERPMAAVPDPDLDGAIDLLFPRMRA